MRTIALLSLVVESLSVNLLDSQYLARVFLHCESPGDVVAVDAE